MVVTLINKGSAIAEFAKPNCVGWFQRTAYSTTCTTQQRNWIKEYSIWVTRLWLLLGLLDRKKLRSGRVQLGLPVAVERHRGRFKKEEGQPLVIIAWFLSTTNWTRFNDDNNLAVPFPGPCFHRTSQPRTNLIAVITPSQVRSPFHPYRIP